MVTFGEGHKGCACAVLERDPFDGLGHLNIGVIVVEGDP